MSNNTPESSKSEILRIVVIYSVFGGLWIYLSDTFLGLFISNPQIITRISMYKGLLFILLTASLLYVLIARYIQRINIYIAELKQAEKKLQASEEMFKSMVETIPLAIYLTEGIEQTSKYINPTMVKMFGYTKEDIPSVKQWWPLAYPDEVYRREILAEWDRRVKLAIETQTPIEPMETVVNCKDGSKKNISWGFITLGDINYAFGLDLTERKKAELELQEKQSDYRNLIATTSDGFWHVDSAGNVLDVNDAYLRQSGYSREELLKMNLCDLEGQESQAETAGHIRRIIMTGSELFESTHRRKDGSTWHVEVSTTYNPFSGGHFIAFLRNITDRKEHEKEQLKIEKLESLGVLAGGIAHDFNNILTGIMGNISFAQKFIDISHKSYKPLAEAEKASVRASELAHQLLTFARGGEPIKKLVSIQHLVNETASLVLSGSNIKGIVDIPDSIHAIKADEGQMSQVFSNIIINAAQAMPGGGKLSVSAHNVTLAPDNALSLSPGTYIRLTFTDQGCGIPENDLKKIFDPYFTTKPAGNGLGLASVHSIIYRHGGHIGAISVIGSGTTFTIHLPSIGETYSRHQAESAAESIGEHIGGYILVMDDEKLIRDMSTEMLDYLGYKVTTCEDGNRAITLYKTAIESGTPFSAVIMDLTIPGGMGGKETAQQILAIDPKACLIVSSGYSNDPVLSDYNSYGFTGAVSKPYSLNELGKQLSLILSKR
ncbi:MAG: PAS domain S-box protein [Geobacteraceae bacterium]|nr:PAS domain S-box protein [Geobacteraceae bacterium]NTW78608.1 PAS domain S-box protein [Geobacteraceae bacterium]